MQNQNDPIAAGGAATVSFAVDPRSLAPTGAELAALALLSLFMAILLGIGAYDVVSFTSPLLLSAILGAAMIHLIRTHPEALWTPIFVVRLSALTFFGVGSLFLYVLGPDFMDVVLGLYNYSAEEGAKAHVVWLVFISTLLIAARAGLLFLTGEVRVRRSDQLMSTVQLGVIFFVLGFTLGTLPTLLNSFGLIAFTPPGFFATAMQAVYSVGIFLIAFWAFGRGLSGAFLILGLVVVSLLFGLLALEKSSIIYPQLLLSLAYLMRGATIRRLATVTVLLVAVFAILQPLVAYQRVQQTQQYGDAPVFNPIERLGYAANWVISPEARESGASNAESFTRLTYTAPAAFVITEYDQGRASDAVSQTLIALVPRILWPDKPSTTSVGIDLYYYLTGRTTSQIAMTVPADIYWNLGWAGTLIIPLLLGPLLMLATVTSYRIVAARDWLMMPFVLLCFRIALSTDNSFVPAVLVPAVMAFIVYWALWGARLLLPVRGAAAPSYG
jgi:hypothetical protein